MMGEEPLETLSLASWDGPFDAAAQASAVAALEAGRILFLPQLFFAIRDSEQSLLTAKLASGSRKNISFDPAKGRIAGASAEGETAAALFGMLSRFSQMAEGLVHGLLPAYAGRVERARASFRPVEVKDRASSVRHDDNLLHVDAFPTRPLQGRRILRLFTNVAPGGVARDWRVGEAFPDFARRFLPQVKRPLPGYALALSLLGVTKGRRSAYDEIMLALHDVAKHDAAWQEKGPQSAVSFPSGTTWMVFTDQVPHAAMAGYCALEQTFHLPVEAMVDPQQSPLRVLEQVAGRRLA